MRDRLSVLFAAIAISVAVPASAAEICGNGIDDDSDGYADDGCFSNWVMGQCISPLSCTVGGDIAPVTGAFVYQLPTDIAPQVPYGPALQFRRTYMSMYSPSATNYRTAMGARWQHNWQSWLNMSGTGSTATVIVHLPTGQEVKFSTPTTISGFDYYTPQAGYHVKWLRQATTSPNRWELRTLTGETLVYNWVSPVGKLVEVWDSLATPNKITLVYLSSGADSGQLDTVTDASGKKRFKFAYTSGLVTSVDYQTLVGTTPTTRVTLSLAYAGTNPTTVQVGGTTIQTNAYTSNYLTSITDGDSKKVIELAYSSSTAGKVVNVLTGEGGVGYEYTSTNSQCTGSTLLLFNTTGTSCASDADCAGARCGGKTGAGGSDGKCYRAARCLQTTSPSEDLVTTMTAVTPCTGACAPTAQYSWNTTTLDLKGIKLADNNWTSFSRNSDGLVTAMAEGDTDDDASNSGGAKTWFFYGNANFPGRVTEKRTRSIIRTEGTFTCDSTSTNYTGCKRTLFVWNSDGLLGSKEEDGWLYDASNSKAQYAYTTTYSYDKGRLTQIDGPLTGTVDLTQFSYFTSTDVLKDGYRNVVKRYKDASLYLATTYDDYDYFGNAKSTQDPDLTYTCRTWDANRNYLAQTREAMAAQTSCATSNTADLTTNYLRDKSLRLTKTTQAGGDCEYREYDSYGRLQYVKRRDDCIATNSGDTTQVFYTANGFNDKTEYLDATGAVKGRVLRSDYDGMQESASTNVVSPSYARSFDYFSDGQLQRVTFENSLGKTVFAHDSMNRPQTASRFTDATNSLSWSFLYPLFSSPGEPTTARTPLTTRDPSLKDVTTDYDDLGRKNRVVSPDTGTTLYVNDAASRLLTIVEAVGVGSYVHSFTYDSLGRKLTEDFSDGIETCNDGVAPLSEVTYVYDSVSCPGVSCTRQTGRLAYVKSKLLCDSGQPDLMLDQETFYSYDDAGRLIKEQIQDDTGRTATQNYAWDKNGNLLEATAPSGASMTYTLGGSGNSDANLVTGLSRSVGGTPTTLLSNVTWAPFGPVTGYQQSNSIAGNAMSFSGTLNLAYRPTQIKYSGTGFTKTTIDYTEDAKGRLTQKLYSNVDSSIQNSYLAYDWLDRISCDSTVSGSCATTGTSVRSNVSFNSSNDRSSFYHYDPSYVSSAIQYTVAYVSGTDKVATVTDGSGIVTNYSFDARGDRSYEDNVSSTFDRRDYTYDQQHHIRTVSVKSLRTTPFGSSWHDTRITYAYDHRGRLVYRSHYNLTTGAKNAEFFYYDVYGRLFEVKHDNTITDTTTYSLYNFYWLDARPVAEWVNTFTSGSPTGTTRYFIHADESNHVIEMYDWPSSGDSVIVGATNPDAYGWDRVVYGPYQPLRPNGALADNFTLARFSTTAFARPAIWTNRDGSEHDPMLAVSLQANGSWPDEPYGPRWPYASAIAPTRLAQCGSCGGCSSASSGSIIARMSPGRLGGGRGGFAATCTQCATLCWLAFDLAETNCWESYKLYNCVENAEARLRSCLNNCDECFVILRTTDLVDITASRLRSVDASVMR